MGYAEKLGTVAQLERQRKPRIIDKDHREPDAVSVTYLRGMGYTVNERPLLVGDWAWDIREKAAVARFGYRRAIVERKTLADMRDTNRLMKQVRRMRGVRAKEALDNLSLFIILIEYKFDTDRKRRWSDEAVRNARLSLQFNHLKVTECDENQIHMALDSLFTWTQKGRHELIA